jgi:hypothetical protein
LLSSFYHRHHDSLLFVSIPLVLFILSLARTHEYNCQVLQDRIVAIEAGGQGIAGMGTIDWLHVLW